jgi:hypothetical protein
VLALWAIALPAVGDIYKCTDGTGSITYQNEKCPAGGKAERVDIFDNNWTADKAEKDAQWQRNAADHRVVTGMPARWVRDGFGEPAEIRDTTTGGATELWVYNLVDRSMQIGMLDGQVLWFRETPVSVPVARSAPTPAASPAAPAAPSSAGPTAAAAAAQRPIDILRAPEVLRPDASRSVESQPAAEATRSADALRAAEAPRALNASPRAARGRACDEVLGELGKPDRQREIPDSDSGAAMTEYVYEPGGGAGPTRTRILCANGKVEGIDRSVAR